jgi:DNA-binding NtrC family response regulator
MPPLRSRPEDIVDIARASLGKFAAEEGKSLTGFDPQVEDILASRAWPGNVRQLLNVSRNVVVLHDGPLVQPGMLPTEITLGMDVPARASVEVLREAWAKPTAPAASAQGRVDALVGMPLADVERELIEATIEHCGGSIPRAAKMLALSPSTVYRKLESWNGVQRRSGT